MQERLTRLALSLAVIRIGADRAGAARPLPAHKGALAATQAAVSEGIVAGGGTALFAPPPRWTR